MTRRTRSRGPIRTHPYTPSSVLPADHRGEKPCMCGRPKANAVHAPAAVAQVDAQQAEHRRRIGDD